MFKRGDEVVTVPGLWHNGTNIGERLATVISTYGHILIAVHEYEDNPVKVFRWEIEPSGYVDELEDLFDDEEIADLLGNLFPRKP